MLPGEVLELLPLQLLLVQGADEHQVGELFNDGDGVGDTARPDIRPNLIHFIFNGSSYHNIGPRFQS